MRNFTAEKKGIWYIYATESDILGNATVEVIEKKDDNDFDNDTTNGNETDKDNKTKKNETDSDQDGMPDDWEEDFGFNSTDPSDVEFD